MGAHTIVELVGDDDCPGSTGESSHFRTVSAATTVASLMGYLIVVKIRSQKTSYPYTPVLKLGKVILFKSFFFARSRLFR